MDSRYKPSGMTDFLKAWNRFTQQTAGNRPKVIVVAADGKSAGGDYKNLTSQESAVGKIQRLIGLGFGLARLGLIAVFLPLHDRAIGRASETGGLGDLGALGTSGSPITGKY